jgi:hypothetical protein
MSEAALSPAFEDPNDAVVRSLSIKLLREILEYQRRLNRLVQRETSDHASLVNAYRRAIRVRREMLRDLPFTES